MEGAPKGQEQQNTTTQWDTLTNPVKVEKKEDQNWDPRLTEEQKDELWDQNITPKDEEYRQALYNYGLKPSSAETEPKNDQSGNQSNKTNDNNGERSKDKVVGTLFEDHIGTTKEEKFKQLTGEDWPGVNYYAVRSNGAEDDGYDNPTTTWTVYERVKEEEPTQDPKPGEDPNKDPKPGDDPEKPGEKKPEDDEKKNKVTIDNLDKIGGFLKKTQIEIDEKKIKRREELEEQLKELLPNIAELYARNRRLMVGTDNKIEFNKIKKEYNKLLDEYLRVKAETTYEQSVDSDYKKAEKRIEELNKEVREKLLEFVGGDPENTDKTQKEVDDECARLVREATDRFQDEYNEESIITAAEAKANAEFLTDFIKQRNDLEEATVNALDNGSPYRKFVSKVLNNKHLKRTMLIAGAAGLAVTGIGLATGAITLGFGLTAAGMAKGAAAGAISGTLMSRQSSKNSAVRGFASEEEIIKKLQNVNVLDKNSDTANVTSWIMEQYSKANTTDAKSNKRRTALSAGIGAVVGAIMSGVQINSPTEVETVQTTNHTTTEYKAANIDNVDIARGHGAYDTFTQMNGDPSKYKEAEQIMYKVAETFTEKQPDGSIKHLFVPGSNGAVEGLGGEVGKYAFTYEGPISQWPDVARSMIEETASKWAEAGLVPVTEVVKETTKESINKSIEPILNGFLTYLARGTGLVVGTGLAGRAIGERPNRINTAENSPEEPEEGTESGGEGETPAPNNPETPDEKREAFKAEIEQAFGDSIGENGSTIMSNNEALGFTQLETIRNWWQSLSDDTRQRVSDFMATSDPSNGQTLRIWLSITQPK